MGEIKIDSDWLVNRARQEHKIIEEQSKLRHKGNEIIAAEALGRILMIKEIYENEKQ